MTDWNSHNQWSILNLHLFILIFFSHSSYWGSRWGNNFFTSLIIIILDVYHCPEIRHALTCICLYLQAPCRKLLTSLIRGLDAHLFKSNHDIYMPNCDKRGFFRKKQVNGQKIIPNSLKKWFLLKGLMHLQLHNNSSFCLIVVCWCSVGHLEVSSVASVGVWTRTACQSPQTQSRKAAWAVRRHEAWTEAEADGAEVKRKRWRKGTERLKNLKQSLLNSAAFHQWKTFWKAGVTLSFCALYWTR